MLKELEKQYEASKYEDDIYKRWEESGYFNPDNLIKDGIADEKADPYTIVLPPPNITAKLHLGHSAMLAIEDLLIRFHRMKGYKALWIPGTDHAAIATQNVVEKALWEKEHKTRHDLGRTEFLKRVDDFLALTQATILKQVRKMGASIDWSREAFTLDAERQKAVKKMFIDMHNDGAIYRGERVVNWCPRCQSTLADDEVEYKEQQGVKFYTFKYSQDFPFTISTTRPETKLGDTAVAVNPKDDRYKKYIGQEFSVDFVGVPLKLKIIADMSVDMEFGTGALGVTPAHSMADYQMSLKNNLKLIKVIDENAKIAGGFGEFSGLEAKAARELVAEKLRQAGLMEKEEEITNNLSVCYRCGHAIEPLPSSQWFVSVDKKLKRLGGKSMKEISIEAAEKGEINFTPERFKDVYLNWMNNLHDWCISRQIWFGHRIPAWYKKTLSADTEIFVGEQRPDDDSWIQDEDTLDTWFSSGMWTFSTLGWPDNFKDGVKSGDLATYHPTNVLETGFEIITLWVSRMIMMSYFALGEKPFSNVYLHGMILDEKGKKMSKSKGNGIDPLDMIEKFGTDAVRLSLLIGNTPGNNLKLGEEKIGQFRNFVNKLWNISRFIIANYDLQDAVEISAADGGELTAADRWILNRLEILKAGVNKDIEALAFSPAGEKLVEFIWNDLADWYLEVCKFEKNDNKRLILARVLRDALRLLHPFAPFVTEAIWSNFNDSMLMVEKYPAGMNTEDKKENFGLVKDIVVSIRNARSENKIEPAKKVEATIYAGKNSAFLKENEILLKSLRTGIDVLEIKEQGEKIPGAITAVVGDIEIYLLGGIDTEKEKKRLEKEAINLEKFIAALKGKLANQDFIARAPEKVVAAEKTKLAQAETELEKFKSQLDDLA